MSNLLDPSRPVMDRQGNPYPPGWQPSLSRVRDAETSREAVAEATILIAQMAPRMMGNEYLAALAEVLMIRLGVS